MSIGLGNYFKYVKVGIRIIYCTLPNMHGHFLTLMLMVVTMNICWSRQAVLEFCTN